MLSELEVESVVRYLVGAFALLGWIELAEREARLGVLSSVDIEE